MSSKETLLTGILYTAIFNPADGRKNWEDMVTAFCYAFAHQHEATLLLKFVNNSPEQYESELSNLLYKLSPFECRVVASNDYLSNTDYEAMIKATSFYVNTSHGEGQCLPLMEFMSAGKPALAPDSSAMADYMDSSVGFVIESSDEPTHWQHDARRHYRALQSRINWASIVTAYQQSFELITQRPEEYLELSRKAREKMKQHCSQASVKTRLANFLTQVAN